MESRAKLLAERGEAVLVLVDMQERLASAMAERERVLAASSRLARTFQLVEAPLVLTRQYPRGLGDTEPALEEVLVRIADEDGTLVRLDKTAFCACGEPEFVESLASLGRHQVVLAGMETHICITQTALDLLTRGYSVQVVADACCSRDRELHEVALDRLRAAGVVVTTSESVMYELVGRAATPEFKSLLGIVKG